MNLEPKAEIKSATRVSGGPATPRKGPPKFKQRQTRQFKSKPPKKGVQGWVALLSFPASDTYEVRICNGFVSPQLWWWYPRNGGFRNRWGHPPRFCWFVDQRSGALHLFLVSRFQISPSFAPGRPSTTWSCTSWLSTASSEPPAILLGF